MPYLKCKICGGNVAVQEGQSLGICEYCGNTMTLPKIEDEQRVSLYNRGNHFRMKGEYDRALAVFEQIIALDDTDAEAHWNIVLCRYGIEYVEDPNTHKHIATCHRASWDSILDDVDYLAALKYADPLAKEVYEREAKYIDDIQKGILAISRSEKNYDIFICYKETTDGGSRTKDSVYAQDLYSRLVKEGYRVFFARITLEDKLGQQYEPYIFSALNSAKVMLAVGTSSDNFNSPWVRNEWSRFLALMKKDPSKLLIPCYRDMDPYDLPDELAMLQSQDMGKIGFEQDLLRGIEKLIRRLDNSASRENVAATVTVESLLKRAKMFLSDCNWKNAREYFDRTLDSAPECAEAYAGKLCAILEAPNIDSLSNAYIWEAKKSFGPYNDAKVPGTLADLTDYKNAIKYADTQLKTVLERQESNVKNELKKLIQNDLDILDHDLNKVEASLSVKQDELYRYESEHTKFQAYLAKQSSEATSLQQKLDKGKTVFTGVGIVLAILIIAIDIIGTTARRVTAYGLMDYIVMAISAGVTIAIVVGIFSFVGKILADGSKHNKNLKAINIDISAAKTSLDDNEKEQQKVKASITQLNQKKAGTIEAIDKRKNELLKFE